MESTFSCVCCGDDHIAVPIHIQGSDVCLECFKAGILPQFEDAIKDETKYPVQWGGHELKTQDYMAHLPPDLVRRWNEKMEEYQTVVQDRLYCRGLKSCIRRAASPSPKSVTFARAAESFGAHQTTTCGAFLGSKQNIRDTLTAPLVVVVANLPPSVKPAHLETVAFQTFGRLTECRLLRADPTLAMEVTFLDEAVASRFLKAYHGSTNDDGVVLNVYAEDQYIAQKKGRVVACTKCASEVCSKCSKVLLKSKSHECQLDTDEDPFRGLIRGRDYQQCPKASCQIKIALRDGCNHMRCKFCKTGFCFVCGDEVAHTGDHWKVGNPCPRFGFPGTKRAIYDRDHALVRQQGAERLGRLGPGLDVAQAMQRLENLLQAGRELEALRQERQRLALQAQERERRAAEDQARLSTNQGYRLMLEEQSQLRNLSARLGANLRTDSVSQLVTLLLQETEVHAAHLRLRPGELLYHFRPETRLANQSIQDRLRSAGWTRLYAWQHVSPVSSIISRYNDAWDGDTHLQVMNGHILGRLRITHRTVIRDVLRQLPLESVTGWVNQLRELCHLLHAGVDIYLHTQRGSIESRQLSHLMHSLVRPRYVEVLAALQNNRSITEDDLAKRASRSLLPVLRTYDLASTELFR